MYKLLLAIIMLVLFALSAESQTILQGQVSDSVEVLVGVTVKISQQGKLVRGALTDVEGNYRMSIDSGSYEVEFNYTGCFSKKFENIEVLPGRIKLLNVTLTSGFEMGETEIYRCHFGPPIFNRDGTESGSTFTADQIRHMY